MLNTAIKRIRLSSSNSSMNNNGHNTVAVHLQLESSAQEITDATFEHLDSTMEHLQEGGPLQESTSVALHLCKNKVLKPYFRLLSMVGWRPIVCPITSDVPWYGNLVNWLYTICVCLIIVAGYVLQYASCFRQDGYPPYNSNNNNAPLISNALTTENPTDSNEINSKYLNTTHLSVQSDVNNDNNNINVNNNENHLLRKCSGNFISLYLIPDILHFFAYLFILQLLRAPEFEQLQNLLERVFLQMTRVSGWLIAHRKLVRTLRSFLWFCLFWITVSIFGHILHIITFQEICFTWMHPNNIVLVQVMTALTVLTLTWNDIICASIVTSYSVHCQLNISYIKHLCISIREKRIDFAEFVKRAEESRKFIDYLNNYQAIGVSLLMISFGCRAVAAIFALLSQRVVMTDDPKTAFVVIISSFLWVTLLSVPIIQAVRLTDACNDLRNIGHELRSRPFGYQDSAQDDLNSLLLYTSSIRMEAKMLYIPMRSSWVVSLLILALIIVLFLGQIGIVKF